jgi:glucan phosphoethanolaminetransferase (alkaline phosphatase superfamily)
MSQKSTHKIAIAAAIICCLIATNASAAVLNEINSSSMSIAMIIAVILAVGIIIYKNAAKNLKKVGKHLEESFGEKVLP